ncbi:TyeA family type III secretion system gatekeeper subunit [Providencia rettgeri]|uniref:TyeA family type III secretion system gatekeeper subunit n=1 Tax=Providencia TaxID=586 RepID=UPI00065DE397|nr:TyeA family type III secretion system gatekeeper subunit [Providencia rettgeri]ELR5178935.1 TyeA family type III secretion system gatekeeper subunit [Providencia rettgeri]ELR5263267.1 TyeA family type III secretion system gatekeeper subunit [Providencia rettgeri]MDK3009770.1 TyeA family type III secretion system gatekeeper subunit [Providencia rettgeri]
MSVKVESIDPRLSLVKNQQLAQQNIELTRQNEQRKLVTQVIPAQSALEIAQNQLNTEVPELDSYLSDGYLIQETQGNIGLAIGNFVRMRGGHNPRVSERPTRSMLQRLAKNLEDSDPTSVGELRHRIGGVTKVEEIDDLLNSFQRHHLDTAECILLLASMLNEKENDQSSSHVLKQTLEKVMAGDNEWVLKLFTHLECGAVTPQALGELRFLYQQATSNQPELLYWFKQFSQFEGSQQQLRTLIRTLSFELSAGYKATDIRLAAVITDLKWLLQFLTIEVQSKHLANSLDLPNITDKHVTCLLLEIVQQSWLYSDWLESKISLQTSEKQYQYARGLMELIKLLPDDCFSDYDQREMVISVFIEYLQQLNELE